MVMAPRGILRYIKNVYGGSIWKGWGPVSYHDPSPDKSDDAEQRAPQALSAPGQEDDEADGWLAMN
jgi:hypothetical protein